MSDQGQQAQVQAQAGISSGVAGDDWWRQRDKHVRRLARTGLDEFQAEEIVDVQEEMIDKVTEKLVTREHFDAEMGDLNSKVESIESDVGDLKSDVRGLNTKVEGIESDVGNLNSKVEGLESDVGVLKSDVRDLNTRVGRLESDVRDIKSDVRGLNTKVGNLDSKVEGLDQKMNTLLWAIGIGFSLTIALLAASVLG